jgi:hypothetical protein
MLAATSRNQTVQVYAMDPVLLLRLVRSHITRQLALHESREFPQGSAIHLTRTRCGGRRPGAIRYSGRASSGSGVSAASSGAAAACERFSARASPACPSGALFWPSTRRLAPPGHDFAQQIANAALLTVEWRAQARRSPIFQRLCGALQSLGGFFSRQKLIARGGRGGS